METQTEPAPGQRARLADIASMVGCSVSVVSRVLRGQGAVSANLSARIREAASLLEYDRGSENRGRPVGGVTIIDLVLPQWGDSWSARVIEGARSAAFSLGYDLNLLAERDEPGQDWHERVVRRGGAGVVAAMIRPTSKQLDMLATARIPLVLIDPPTDPQSDVPIVSTADFEGGFTAGRHLGELHRSRAIALAGVPRFRWGRARLEGVEAGLASTNPSSSFETVEVAWGEPHSVARSLKPVLRNLDEPAVLFANLDYWAFQVYDLAAELGLTIPSDLAVMGFDDEPAARYLRPPLTTMRQPLTEIAHLAVELIASDPTRKPGVHNRHEIPSTIIVRGSTAP